MAYTQDNNPTAYSTILILYSLTISTQRLFSFPLKVNQMCPASTITIISTTTSKTIMVYTGQMMVCKLQFE